MWKSTFIGILMLLILLSGCTSTDTPPGVDIPTLSPPTAGMSSVTGRVIHKQTKEPFTNTIVRLAEIVRPEQGEDVFVLDQAFSPGARTDEAGIFVFQDVEPKEYAIVVGDVERIYEIIPDSSGAAKSFPAEPEESFPLAFISPQWSTRQGRKKNLITFSSTN